jgi:uncharacterized protein (TIGR02001 family)
MKRITFIFLTICSALTVAPQLEAQEWNTGLDIYSSYVWRGTKFGSGPAFQPSLEFSAGNLAIGAWGSYSASTDEAAEADLYISYNLGIGEKGSIGFTVTDYYFPGSSWMEKNSHYLEPMVTVGAGALSMTGAYMMNNGEGYLYLEAGISAGPASFVIGAGDGIYTTDGKFNLCNLGISSSKEIKITDTFSLPLSGAVILNPSSRQFHVVAGISL